VKRLEKLYKVGLVLYYRNRREITASKRPRATMMTMPTAEASTRLPLL